MLFWSPDTLGLTVGDMLMNLEARAPETESELFARALDLAGSTLGQLGEKLGIAVPQELLRAKGWFGQALELFLGATARSRAAPDFEALGIELKTLPVVR